MPDLFESYSINLAVLIASASICALTILLIMQWQSRRVLDARLDAVLTDRDKYRSLAEEAMTYLDAMRVRMRVNAGESDFEHVPRIRPVRHSDPTRIAEDKADAQSLEQRLHTITDDLERLTRKAVHDDMS